MADISNIFPRQPYPSINMAPKIARMAMPWDRPRSDVAIVATAPKKTSETPITAEDFDVLPDEMRAARRWLVWRLVPDPDPAKKPRKVPYYASGVRRHGKMDTAEDMASFVTFDEALRALQTGNYSGLGFALGPDGTGNCWQGIDLDDMPNRPALGDIADDLPGYTETSPSGTGMHAIGYGRTFPSLGSNTTGIEAYACRRFFTVTGAGAGIHPPTCLADFVATRLKPLHSSRQESSAATSDDAAAPIEQISPQTVMELRSALRHMRADDRELWVRIGHALKTLGEVGRGLFMDWSSISKKFDLKDAAEKWDSFAPVHTHWRAVFVEAQQQGWVNPASHAALGTDWRALSDSPEGIAGPDRESPSEATLDPVAALEANIVALSTLETPVECLPHYVEMWIPHNEVTLLAGHGGGGKSYVALSISVHVALGLPFGNLATTQAKVLFFSGEDGAEALKMRLAKICRALKIDPAVLDGKLILLDASDIDPALHREQRVSVGGRQQIVTETVLLNTLAALVQKLDVGLVVVDNASDAYDDDEIKRARVRAFIRSLRSRIARPGRAVLLLAHINKESAKAGTKPESESYSGSTAWHNSVRSRLSLAPTSNDAMTIDHMKANLGPKAAQVRLEWHDGVPLVAGSHINAGAAVSAVVKAGENARDNADKAALVMLIQDFDKRGERVTTSAQGSATVFKLLKGQSGFPKGTASDRLMRLLRELESEGRIYRRTVKTADRKWREAFTCVPAPESAPIPEVEAAMSDDEQEVACAD